LKKRADAVIIGGGVSGCGLAYGLAKRGFRDVVVLERDYLASGATGRCGGGIRQQWSTEENTRLAMESVQIFKGLDEELGYETEFAQGGYWPIPRRRSSNIERTSPCSRVWVWMFAL
jgi:sarcosine oxidase subunit beta